METSTVCSLPCLLTPSVALKQEVEQTFPALAGELDAAITAFTGCHLITCPVFGRPPAADKAQLLVAIAGDHRSKSRVIALLVPAVAKRAFDMGENLEKGEIATAIELHAGTGWCSSIRTVQHP